MIEASELAIKLSRIESLATEIERLSDSTYMPMGCVITDVEWFSLAVVVKSTSNSHAFKSLIESRNTIAATAIVRMQIEAAMRIFGLSLVDDIDEAGSLLMRGEKYSSLRMRQSRARLVDKVLHEELSKLFGWVSDVYEETSAFVHLDGANIKSKLLNINGRFFFNLHGTDKGAPEDKYHDIADAFLASLEVTKSLLVKFLSTRPQPPERAAELDEIRRSR